jgi:hypothetical protein
MSAPTVTEDFQEKQKVAKVAKSSRRKKIMGIKNRHSI